VLAFTAERAIERVLAVAARSGLAHRHLEPPGSTPPLA
jgi:hypothetical protein